MEKIEAYKTFISASFDIKMNANDFFNYACAQMVGIVSDDAWWVIEHIEKYGDNGVNSAMAYIQNQEPISPYRTNEFNEAIKELIDRKQEVRGDIDWEFHYYNDNGPYRTINKED
jgi:hypothetical protein